MNHLVDQLQDLIATAGFKRYMEPFRLDERSCLGVSCPDDEVGSLLFRLLEAADYVTDRDKRSEVIALVESVKTTKDGGDRTLLYWPDLLL